MNKVEVPSAAVYTYLKLEGCSPVNMTVERFDAFIALAGALAPTVPSAKPRFMLTCGYDSRIAAIKFLRNFCNLGLKESKDMIDAATVGTTVRPVEFTPTMPEFTIEMGQEFIRNNLPNSGLILNSR